MNKHIEQRALEAYVEWRNKNYPLWHQEKGAFEMRSEPAWLAAVEWAWTEATEKARAETLEHVRKELVESTVPRFLNDILARMQAIGRE